MGNQENLKKIKSTSQIVKIVSTVVLFAMPVILIITCLALFVGLGENTNLMVSGIKVDVNTLQGFEKGVVLLVTILICAMIFILAFFIRKLFTLFYNGEIFTDKVVKVLKTIGGILIPFAFVNVFCESAITLIVSENKSIMFGDTSFVTPFVMGLIVFIVARIMSIAREYKADCDLTI